MASKSFVDIYAEMIKKHNQTIADQTVVNEADDQEQNTEEGQNKEQTKQEENQDDNLDLSDLDLSGDNQSQGEDKEQNSDSQNDEFSLDDEDELKDEPQTEYNPDDFGEENAIELNFSVELATEFSNTVNSFTKICADIVKNRSVKKSTSDELDKYVKKIKSLIQAAEESI